MSTANVHVIRCVSKDLGDIDWRLVTLSTSSVFPVCCVIMLFVLRSMVWHLVALFFFFFKRKPAYERRISDWSSDVCSSDLPRARRRHRRDRQQEPAAAGELAIAPAAQQRAVYLDDRVSGAQGQSQGHPRLERSGEAGRQRDHAEPEDLRRRALELQIGRAPCRERVCQ